MSRSELFTVLVLTPPCSGVCSVLAWSEHYLVLVCALYCPGLNITLFWLDMCTVLDLVSTVNHPGLVLTLRCPRLNAALS